MNTITTTVLYTAFTLGAVAFLFYWLGASHEQRRTRQWARRALRTERIALILAAANNEHIRKIQALEDGTRPLTPVEARYFDEITRWAGK